MSQETKLRYLDEMFKYSDTGTVQDVKDSDEGKKVVILDQTIFYPQGGGQPSDTGSIKKGDAVFKVDMVTFVNGVVEHHGFFECGSFDPGDTVDLSVDEGNRVLNARIHTAGHLIDTVVSDLGFTALIPTKGYHFPEGPNVEYEGILPAEEREEFKKNLEEELNKRISEGYEIKRVSAQGNELDALCTFVPDYLPKNKPIWVATVWGEKGMPCGGTHVKNISEIGKVTIRKVKCKKGRTKVSYEVI